MKLFIFGTIFGIVLNTVGFSGLAKLADVGVNKVQTVAKEAAERRSNFASETEFLELVAKVKRENTEELEAVHRKRIEAAQERLKQKGVYIDLVNEMKDE